MLKKTRHVRTLIQAVSLPQNPRQRMWRNTPIYRAVQKVFTMCQVLQQTIHHTTANTFLHSRGGNLIPKKGTVSGDRITGTDSKKCGLAQCTRTDQTTMTNICQIQHGWRYILLDSEIFCQKSSINPKLFINLSNSLMHNGNSVFLWKCVGIHIEMWIIDTYGRYIHSDMNMSKCLDGRPGGVLYKEIILWDCLWDAPHQSCELLSNWWICNNHQLK
jgi:hypothetical protein